MACKYIYKGTTYSSKEEFISKVIPTLKNSTLSKFDKVPTNKQVYLSSIKNYEDNIVNFEKAIQAIKDNNYKIILPNNAGRYVASVESEGIRGGTIPIAENPYSKEAKEGKFDKEYALSYLKERIEREEGSIENENRKIKEIEKVENDIYNKNINSNQFLQLLNKNNNWVTFFIKSIIQDSAKKGYEKVLFPTGNTASKVEGHSTLEEFKKQKEDRIKELENKLKEIASDEFFNKTYKIVDNQVHKKESTKEYPNVAFTTKVYNEKEGKEVAYEFMSKSSKQEINQLKQELERVETEGFGALKPIFNFYENTVTNILKKNGYLPNIITDEYGNTWNEVEIKPEYLNKILFSKKSTVDKKNDITSRMSTLLQDFAKVNNIKVEFIEKVLDDNNNEVNGFYDSVKKVIKINQKLAETDTFPEELAHYLTLALGEDHTLVKRAFNLMNKVDYRGFLGQTYIDTYNNDETLLKHEYLGKLVAKVIAEANTPEELLNEPGFALWETIKRMLDAFVRLFKPNYNIQSELDNLSKELAKMILSTKEVESTDLFIKMFSVNNKNIIAKDIRPQYVYYKGLLGKLKSDLSKLEPSSDEFLKTNEKILKIEASLKEISENGNKQVLLNLANETLDEIEEYVNKLKQVVESGNKPNVDKIERTVKVLHMFENMIGVKDRVGILLNDTLQFAKVFVLDEMQGLTGKEFDESIFNQLDTDISAAEANFGTLADVKNYLGKTIGLLIKKAQNKIEVENKKSFERINNAVNKLTDYQKSRGLSGTDIYKIFLQEHKGTLVLTKPYTTEFYKKISDSFKEPNGFLIRSKLATYNSATKEFIPRDNKYNNKDYETIQNTKELKEFYNFFKGIIAEVNDKLPEQYKQNSNFIPNIVERTLMDIMKSDKTMLSKLKDGANHMLEINDYSDNDRIFDENLEKDSVPVKYLGKLSKDIKSKDLGSVLLKYAYFANSYEEMTDVLPKARLFQELVKQQEFIKNTNKNKSVYGEDTKLNEMIDSFIKMQVLGEMKREEKYAPHIDFMLKYTSLLRIGLNPFNASVNFIIGNIGNLIEAVGGRHFTTKEYLEAIKIFSKENLVNDSKLNKLAAKFNPLMELDDYENLEKINVGSNEYKDKIKSLMYLPQRMGEKQMQTSTMIALLLHNKVTTKEGNTISMWEAFNESGEWNSELMGYELDDNFIFKTTNKIHRINQLIHGRYSQKDAAALTQYSLFRAAFQFKKWIPAAIESRFGGKRFDERLDVEIEGRYRTYIKGFNYMIAKFQNDVENIEKYSFNETDVYNMRKNMIELTLLLGTVLAGIGFDDDKKRKDPTYKFLMSQLNQISGDLMYFYNPKALTDPAKLSVPMLKTAQDLIKVIEYTPSVITGDKFKRGRFKGENKELASLINVTPVIKPIADFARLWNKDPYQK